MLALTRFLHGADGAVPTLLGGTLAMKTLSWTAAALAAAVLVVAWFARGVPGGSTTAAEANPAEPVLAASAPPSAPDSAALQRSTPATEGRVEHGASPAPELPRVRVRAHLVDARGARLRGAELVVRDAERFTARADENGDVELVVAGALPARDDLGTGALVAFVARAEGCGETLRLEPPPAGEVLELGEMRLVPIGSVAGVVRDASGRALAGADVRLCLPTLGLGASEHGELFGPPYSLGERRVLADAAGRFLIEDVSEGAWRAWAGAQGWSWRRGEPLRVERGVAVPEIELVLAPLPEANLVRGRTLAPDGRALVGIQVLATPAGASEAQSYALSEPDGAFELALLSGAPYRLHARDERSARDGAPRYSPASADGVRAGGAEVVLVLPEARWLALEVVDRDGAPADALVTSIYGVPEQRDFFAMPARGHARVLVPDEPFRVRVAAEGFASVELGPFEPAATPAELRVVLAPLARVRGVVKSAGRPVADAIVQLVRLAHDDEIVWLDGFPARLDGEGLVGTTSDARGRFELPIGLAAEYALYAEKQGFPAGERGPLRLDPARDEELDVELPTGGAVEGRVLVAEGESPAGILVKLARGDMRVHEGVTDADGSYRIAALTPGPYMVQAQRRRTGSTPGFAVSPIEVVKVSEFRFPWALEVRAGETVRHDIDLAAQELATVTGFLRVDGAAPPVASVRLVRKSDGWSQRAFDADEQALASDGSFAFEPHRTEDCWLVFESSSGALAGTTLVRALALEPGTNRVELELASAAVSGTLPAGESGPFALVIELAPDTFAVAPIDAHAGAFTLTSVPAAPNARLVGWRSDVDRSALLGWHEFAHVSLPAGRATVIE